MATLEDLITSGRIVDIALTFLVVEVIAIFAVRRLTGGGVPMPSLLINAGAGGSLMLALRAALTGPVWQTVAAFLVLALVFHVADVGRRWQPPATG